MDERQKEQNKIMTGMKDQQNEQNKILAGMKDQQEKIINALDKLNENFNKMFSSQSQPAERKWFICVLIGQCQTSVEHFVDFSCYSH